MEHTYLRYECADSFGITVAAASSKAPPSNAILAVLEAKNTSQSSWNSTRSSTTSTLLATAGSYCIGYDLRKGGLISLKLGHRERLSGGVGTGRALNSDEIVCLDVASIDNVATDDTTSTVAKVATGWVDGAVRIFDLYPKDLMEPRGIAHSIIHGTNDSLEEEFIQREPLVLSGHNGTCVRTLAFSKRDATRLASGGSDGSVILWDVVAETGLFRLLGHHGAITEIMFLDLSSQLQALVTSCLDGLVKVWDLKAQCCVQTIASHRGEILGAACMDIRGLNVKVSPGDNEQVLHRWRLITGGTDGQTRVWSVQNPKRAKQASTEHSDEVDISAANDTTSLDDVCQFMGMIGPPPNVAVSSEKISSIRFHKSGRFLGVLRAGSKNVEIYSVKTSRESMKKRQRRLRRRQEKLKKKVQETQEETGKKRGMLDDPDSGDEDDADAETNENQMVDPSAVKASDEFEYATSIAASHKVRSFVFLPGGEKREAARVVCALATNSIETYSLTRKHSEQSTALVWEAERVSAMDMDGHPTGIRAVALSSDDSIACTVSKNVTKIWSVDSRTCIQSLSPIVRTEKGLKSCYGLCATFLPGNSHVVVGTREGHLVIIDIAAGEIASVEEAAHDAAIWSIDLRRASSDDTSIHLVTGSADKTVKFWTIESETDYDDSHEATTSCPVPVHTRTLQMTDDVVAVRYSFSIDPKKRMVFVSTLDSTIKVFFDDSLKLFLSLYGHKLPALAVDASDDDMILASAGADKTVKIWGLDFGDTHRTLHGHEDSITDLRFVKRTHNFFTSSKDGTLRYWDGDRFEQILLLTGHTAEVNCLSVSRSGAFVLSGGMDRQVRVWERTKDIVFLEEERERELELAFDRMDNREEGGTAGILARKEADSDDEDGAKDDEPQSEAAVRKSVMSVSSGDRILEAIERADQELKEIQQFRKVNKDKVRQPSMFMLGLEPAHYILWILKSIKSAELEQSLLVLPLRHVERLIYYCSVLLKQGRGIELCCKVSIFLVKVHQKQITTDKSLATPLRELRRIMRLRLGETRDMVGYNLAALRLVARVSKDKRQSYLDENRTNPDDIWAGLGVGSDVAAALEGRPKRR